MSILWVGGKRIAYKRAFEPFKNIFTGRSEAFVIE
jgi:hypothetical protein